MTTLLIPRRSTARRLLFLGMLGAVIGPAALADEEADPPDAAPASAPVDEEVVITPDGSGTSFDFESSEIEGTLRADGDYHGISRLVDKRTGRQLIAPKISALNFYRLMATNLYMDRPRKMERQITALEHGMEIHWPATAMHKAELTARYEVVPPHSVDVTVTVRSQGIYSGYELFMPSYFDKALRPHIYLRPDERTPAGGEPPLVVPTVNDVFRGTVLVFPRDSHAARRCVDGRWDRYELEGGVQMCPVRHYAYCLAFLTDPDEHLAVVLMADPRDCYSISARYHAENDADRLTPYSAFDFSLFGDDLVSGDERSVKVRLSVIPLDGDLSPPLALYQAFLAQKRGPLPGGQEPESEGESP